jgi:hypothetical protein
MTKNLLSFNPLLAVPSVAKLLLLPQIAAVLCALFFLLACGTVTGAAAAEVLP